MHVKPEHGIKDLDEEDDLEDEEDEDRKSNDMLGHHHLHHHHHHHHHQQHMMQQQMNRPQHQPHPHNMYLKDQIPKPPSNSVDCGIPLPPSKPKIWSLADTAACKTPPPSHVQQQATWCVSTPPSHTNPTYMNNAARSGFISPGSGPYSSRYGYYGGPAQGVCGGGGSSSGFPDVQTDTPPQTPPNMKLPSVASNLVNGSSNVTFSPSNAHVSPPITNGYTPSQGHQATQYANNCYNQLTNSPHKDKSKISGGYIQQGQPFVSHPPLPSNAAQSPNDDVAFKPFYKK